MPSQKCLAEHLPSAWTWRKRCKGVCGTGFTPSRIGFHTFLFLTTKNAPTPAAATTAMITKTIQIGNHPPLLPDEEGASSKNTANHFLRGKTLRIAEPPPLLYGAFTHAVSNDLPSIKTRTY